MEISPPRRRKRSASAKRQRVVNLKKAELEKVGYHDIDEWLSEPNHLYIGRGMHYPHLTVDQSKWRNPFPAKTYGRNKCMEMYEDYLRNSELYDCLEELEGKTLGCWCYPEPCHGEVLLRLLEEKKHSKSRRHR